MSIYSVKMWSDVSGKTKLTARLYYKDKSAAKKMFETLSLNTGGSLLNSRKSVILEREDLETNKWSILKQYNDKGI
jgi:hypothetical protein